MKTNNNQVDTPWHIYTEDKILQQLETSLEGLTDLDVAKRKKKFGLNLLPTIPPPGLIKIILSQFKNPLIYILIIAAVVSFLLKEYTDAGFIFAVLVINALIGTIQEWSAEKSAASLQKLIKIKAKVKRNGKEEVLEAESLVPGDILYLESGNHVPADIRILNSNELQIDESLLTGESIAVHKTTKVIDEDVPIGDRVNMAYAGTTVMNGRGMGVVVGTGHFTEIGNIAKIVKGINTLKSPLVTRMDRFAKHVALYILFSIGLLALIAYFRGFQYYDIFFFTVALAVSAIPEGLPIAITVALSIATKRMAKRNVIVRKLTAVEGLGSCTFIASDKTGTLTVNKQTVKKIILPEGLRFEVTGKGYSGDGTIINLNNNDKLENAERNLLNALCKAGSICNESSLMFENGHWVHFGDAVDLALLALTYKNGQNPHKIKSLSSIKSQLPFESDRKYAATFCQEGESYFVYVKGAFETILPLCKSVSTTKGVIPINVKQLEKQAKELAQRGYRVIAISAASLKQLDKEVSEMNIPPLSFLGLVGLMDPLRNEVINAIRKCTEAGVEVAIITGDHPLTAVAIAKEIGIAEDMKQVITGIQLKKISTTVNEEFISTIQGKKVFARVSPLQKMQIIEALSRSGQFVAVTGDGVNDVPALKKANIGVAMGSGTDLAKETAEIIITDDNFSSIESGIEGGRFAYDNIRKVTYLLIATGVAEIILFLLSLVGGLPLPLVAVQLLWLNLVTNGIQDVGLAFEKGEPEAVKRPPRNPEEGIFNRLMINQSLTSGFSIGIIAFGIWKWLLDQAYDEIHARTLLLMFMVFAQNVHVFNCRSERNSTFKVPLNRNWFLIGSVILAQLTHIVASHSLFMQKVLKTETVSIREWFILFALSLNVLLVMEIFKLIIRKKKT